jgi:hypothetical protein
VRAPILGGRGHLRKDMTNDDRDLRKDKLSRQHRLKMAKVKREGRLPAAPTYAPGRPRDPRSDDAPTSPRATNKVWPS